MGVPELNLFLFINFIFIYVWVYDSAAGLWYCVPSIT